jgi:hypothetical protein
VGSGPSHRTLQASADAPQHVARKNCRLIAPLFYRGGVRTLRSSSIGPKVLSLAVATGALLLGACATYGPYHVSGLPYGAPLKYFYGEGRHPGVDFAVPTGTPVIAPTAGVVRSVRKDDRTQPNTGGWFVGLSHGEHFDSSLTHLSAVHVQTGQMVPRGALIGLSGAMNSGDQLLHFGICRKGGNCGMFSQTEDPQRYWLGGKPRCFDPATDYSRYTPRDLTAPLACGVYARLLFGRIKERALP